MLLSPGVMLVSARFHPTRLSKRLAKVRWREAAGSNSIVGHLPGLPGPLSALRHTVSALLGAPVIAPFLRFREKFGSARSRPRLSARDHAGLGARGTRGALRPLQMR